MMNSIPLVIIINKMNWAVLTISQLSDYQLMFHFHIRLQIMSKTFKFVLGRLHAVLVDMALRSTYVALAHTPEGHIVAAGIELGLQ